MQHLKQQPQQTQSHLKTENDKKRLQQLITGF